MINKNVIERLKGKWFVQVNDDFELANVINVCFDLNINWNHQGIKNCLPTTIHEYPFFIGVYKHFPYLSYSYCDFKGCENITDLFFENINNDPEREHLHKILDAWLDGEDIESSCYEGCWINQTETLEGELTFKKGNKYRIKPKATPLPIPNWFWSGISKSLTKAVLNAELDTITFFPKYVTPRIEDGHWITDDHPYYNYVNPALIGVSLKDIDWRLSLTERPSEVNHEL